MGPAQAAARGPGDFDHRLVPDVNAAGGQALDHLLHALFAPVARPTLVRAQPRRRGVHEVAQDVQPPARVDGADFDARNDLDGDSRSRPPGVVKTLGGVVIGERDHIQPPGRGGLHHARRRLGAVRGLGMQVEVQAHGVSRKRWCAPTP